MLVWGTLLVVVVGTVEGSRQERQAFNCGPGKSCIPLFSCKDFRDILGRPNAHTSISVRRALCSRDRRNPMVCCRGSLSHTPPTSRPEPPITFPTTPITFPTPSPGNRCPLGQSCTPLRSCTAFHNINNNLTPDVWRRIRRAICNNDRRNIHVCCVESSGPANPTPTPTPTPTPAPTPTPTPTPPIISSGEFLLPAKCGVRTKRQTLPEGFTFPPIAAIVPGVPVKLTEFFPWMAVLGYNSRTSPSWNCGGSLITEQYVLTAAHCVHSDFTLGATLTVVRLGELNLETPIDCEDGVCADPHQDFSPVDVILHPNFNIRTHVSDDIALIRLDRKVTLNDYVDPLCLPPAGANVESLLRGEQAEVSGWGLTDKGVTATVLQKASIPFVSKATCNPIYDNELVPEQICFGGGQQDSCRGDSGGPVVVKDRNTIQIGIVSRGRDSRCGVEGIPAVYTHVAAYRNWITQNLRP